MPIDYQNELGVTVLHIAAQNGNKRIAKLCLRRGADVNKQNNNGQVIDCFIDLVRKYDKQMQRWPKRREGKRRKINL